jgi:hypothetical protein
LQQNQSLNRSCGIDTAVSITKVRLCDFRVNKKCRISARKVFLWSKNIPLLKFCLALLDDLEVVLFIPAGPLVLASASKQSTVSVRVRDLAGKRCQGVDDAADYEI